MTYLWLLGTCITTLVCDCQYSTVLPVYSVSLFLLLDAFHFYLFYTVWSRLKHSRIFSYRESEILSCVYSIWLLIRKLYSRKNNPKFNNPRKFPAPDIHAVMHFKLILFILGWAQLMETEMKGWSSVGVVAAIVPWNFPLMLLAWKVYSISNTPRTNIQWTVHCSFLVLPNTIIIYHF